MGYEDKREEQGIRTETLITEASRRVNRGGNDVDIPLKDMSLEQLAYALTAQLDKEHRTRLEHGARLRKVGSSLASALNKISQSMTRLSLGETVDPEVVMTDLEPEIQEVSDTGMYLGLRPEITSDEEVGKENAESPSSRP